MEAVGIRELADRASSVVSEIQRTGHPVIVTNRGRPVAVVSAIDEDAFYNYVLANAPEYTRTMRETEDRYERRESDSRPLADVIADLAEEEHHASA